MKLFLAACLLGVVVASPLPGEPRDGILPVVSEIKGIVSTDYGFKQVKAYLLQLKSEDPIAQRIRDTIHRHSDEELQEAFNAFFAKIPMLAIDPGFDYPTLETLFGEVKGFLSTDAGVAVARTYMELLDSPNEIVQGIVSRLTALDDAELKNFFAVMFSHVPDVPEDFFNAFYDNNDALRHIAEQIKAILSTSAGIQQVREHLKSIQTTNPTFILIKTVLSAMSDTSLIDLVKEAGKNLKDVQIENNDLLALLVKGKELLVTDDGILFLKEYFGNLQTSNFMIVRVKTLVQSSTKEELVTVIEKGAALILGQFYSAFYVTEAEMKHIGEQFKAILTTSEGIQQIRDHLKTIQTTNPTIILVKTVLSAMSDASLIDLVKELGKNIEDKPIEPESRDLLALAIRGLEMATSDEGIKYIKDYLEKLQTSNFMIIRLKTFVTSMSDDELKAAMKRGAAVILGVGYAAFDDTDAEIKHIGEQFKAILTTSEGIQQVRDHLKTIHTTNPTLILVRTVLSAMSDASLIDLVKEIAKNIEDKPIAPESKDVLALAIRGVELATTEKGMKYIKDYLQNLQTSNPMIVRLKTFVLSMSDEDLIAAIKKRAGEVLGTGYVLGSASYAEDLRYLFTWIKHNLKSDYYFQQLKKYLTNLKATNVYVKLGKEYFLEMSEDEMREVLREFLKDFADIAIEPGFDYPDLLSLFGKVKTAILTSNGLQQLREYAAKLQSDNHIVQEIQGALLMVDDDTLTGVLVDLFQGI